MTLRYRITASTGIHQGDREYQQDQVAIWPHPWAKGCLLAIVADGMGGRSGGRQASNQVLHTAKQMFDRFSPKNEDPAELLKQIVHEAHTTIRLTAASSEQEPHSTVVAFLITPNESCYWIHSGDSRIYHFNNEEMCKRTTDHSYVQALVDKGEITEEEAHTHKNSNVLLSCLGTMDPPLMGFHKIEQLRPGDSIMACSDGVWHYFNSRELATIVSSLPARDATEFLIKKARDRTRNKEGDNLSVVIVRIDPLPEAPPPANSEF